MTKRVRDPEEQKLLMKTFWHSFGMQYSINIAKMCAHCYLVMIQPWLDYFYKDDPEERIRCMIRNNEFYNCNFTFSNFIVGMGIAMEKERARTLKTDNPMDGRIISNMKVSLQGPLSSLGDTIMFNTVRVIAAGIAMPLCADGTILGPFIFIGIQLVIQLLFRYNLLFLGYDIGLPFIEKFVASGLITAATSAAAVLGLTMVGAMVSTMVRVPIRWRIEMGDVTLVIQDVLNQIMPNMLPLVMFFVTISLLRKKHSPAKIILVYMGACIVLGILGIM